MDKNPGTNLIPQENRIIKDDQLNKLLPVTVIEGPGKDDPQPAPPIDALAPAEPAPTPQAAKEEEVTTTEEEDELTTTEEPEPSQDPQLSQIPMLNNDATLRLTGECSILDFFWDKTWLILIVITIAILYLYFYTK